MGIVLGMIFMLMVYGALNFYVAFKLYKWLKLMITSLNPYLYYGIYLVLAVMVILSFMITNTTIVNIVNFVIPYWMGIFVYFLVYFAIVDIIMLFGRLFRLIPRQLPQKVNLIIGLVVVVSVLITVSYGIFNARNVKSVTYNVKSINGHLSEELRIVLVSDIHLGAVSSSQRLGKIIDLINSQQPDIVCLAGDIFDGAYQAVERPDEAIEQFLRISSKYGVYASLGNHDAGSSVNEMLDFLEKANIKVLNDEYEVIDNQLILVGRLDGTPIGGYGEFSRSSFDTLLTEFDDYNLPIVVMDHNPAYINEYGSQVDLILSGHTHKGQLFPANLITNAIYEVDYGHYQKDENSPNVVVSSGAGIWGIPMRVGSNCEVVTIKFQ